MAKLTREQKMEIYEKRKSGQTISSISHEYGINESVIKYFTKLIDRHGIEILRGDKNRYYSPDFKEAAINRINDFAADSKKLVLFFAYC